MSSLILNNFFQKAYDLFSGGSFLPVTKYQSTMGKKLSSPKEKMRSNRLVPFDLTNSRPTPHSFTEMKQPLTTLLGARKESTTKLPKMATTLTKNRVNRLHTHQRWFPQGARTKTKINDPSALHPVLSSSYGDVPQPSSKAVNPDTAQEIFVTTSPISHLHEQLLSSLLYHLVDLKLCQTFYIQWIKVNHQKQCLTEIHLDLDHKEINLSLKQGSCPPYGYQKTHGQIEALRSFLALLTALAKLQLHGGRIDSIVDPQKGYGISVTLPPDFLVEQGQITSQPQTSKSQISNSNPLLQLFLSESYLAIAQLIDSRLSHSHLDQSLPHPFGLQVRSIREGAGFFGLPKLFRLTDYLNRLNETQVYNNQAIDRSEYGVICQQIKFLLEAIYQEDTSFTEEEQNQRTSPTKFKGESPIS